MKGTRYGSEPFFGPPSIIKFVAPAGIVTLFVPSFPRLRIDTLEERFHSIVKFSLLKGFPESALRTWKTKLCARAIVAKNRNANPSTKILMAYIVVLIGDSLQAGLIRPLLQPR